MPIRHRSRNHAAAAIMVPWLTLWLATPAHAELPPAIRAMLNTAVAKGDASDIAVVARYAKLVSPADAAAVDAIVKAHATAAATGTDHPVRTPEPPTQWKGQGQFGLTQASGNTNSFGVTAGVDLTREEARWRTHFHALFNYQRTNGATSQDSALVAVEPNYKFDDRLFLFGLAQFDRDRIQGFGARETVSAGLGDRLVDAHAMTLDVKAAPAYRYTSFTNGTGNSAASGLVSADYKWRVMPRIALAETASLVTDADDTTVTSLTALDAKLDRSLSARLSYRLNSESRPLPGLRPVDTLAAMSVVYGF